ncbi:MAG: hypothetical protein QOH81_3353 [Sphingomonadales bacterium]|jgi:hypothetical protein|nr:hypothetical protein [Sphingomonadales bacterium]
MSPALLLLDLIALVLGLPVLWTLRSMAEPMPATVGRADFSAPCPHARASAAIAGPPSAEARRRMRDILGNWHHLSAADVARLDAALGSPESHVGTVPGSPANLFWSAAAELGWARRVPAPVRRSDIATGMFALTGTGCRLLPDFRRRYDLVLGTSYAPAEPAQRT